MGTIWTPGGERPVGGADQQPDPRQGAPADAEAADVAELEARMEQLRQQLANTPVEVVVANHAYGLFELAALHLSMAPPNLPEAQLAIDALGAITEGLAGRLGEQEPQLREGLTQLRLAFVQLASAAGAANSDGGTPEP